LSFFACFCSRVFLAPSFPCAMDLLRSSNLSRSPSESRSRFGVSAGGNASDPSFLRALIPFGWETTRYVFDKS
jgi:hypothetical protein